MELTRQAIGQQAEDQACAHLQARGLRLLERNYRVARGPHARGGEIDLIMQDRDGTVVFVEVRARASARWGGAGASIGWAKQRALRLAAHSYLRRFNPWPPLRFDVVVLEGDRLSWWPGALSFQG